MGFRVQGLAFKGSRLGMRRRKLFTQLRDAFKGVFGVMQDLRHRVVVGAQITRIVEVRMEKELNASGLHSLQSNGNENANYIGGGTPNTSHEALYTRGV